MHIYHKISTNCDTHGEYLADPVQYHKGIKELCPKCNPAVKIHTPYNINKIISKMQDKYPNDTQLKTQDLSTIRGDLLDLQNGICPLCNRSINKPIVDHWHTKKNNGNGKVRMVLCATCNSMLGVIENHLPRYLIDYSDAPNWLDNLVRYLQVNTTNLIHPTERPRIKLNKTEFKKLSNYVKTAYNKVIKYPIKGLLNKRQEDYYNEYIVYTKEGK